VAVIFDDDVDSESGAGRFATAGSHEIALPYGAWFSVAGTDDPAALSPEAFAQGGAADAMVPGALLAALAEGVLDPAVLPVVSDNALLGVVGASQRLMSRAAAMMQRAVAEYARRNRDADPSRASRAGFREFSPDDLAPELVVNTTQAETAMLRHESSERRLPACSQALWDGKIGEYQMKIIADAAAGLDDKGAAEADEILAQGAPGLTPGQLRALAARVVLMIDPGAAEERRRDAATRARVVKYREDAGTAALCGRDLPSDAVLRSWQHIDAAARALHASGIKAGLDKLRAAVYLGLTSGTDPLTVLPLLQEATGEPVTPDARTGGGAATDRETWPWNEPCEAQTQSTTGKDSAADGDPDGDHGPDDLDEGGDRRPDDAYDADDGRTVDGGSDGGHGGHGREDSDGGEGGARRDGPGTPAPHSPGGGAVNPRTGPGAPYQAVINLLVPVGTGFGWSSAPGEIPGCGPLDPETTRDMMVAASRHAGTRWCVTMIGEDGTAVAHGCAAGQHPWSPWSGVDPDLHGAADLRQQAAKFLASLHADLAPVAKGTCDHAEYTDRYEVPRKLKHLIRARTATCVAPCCNRPAAHHRNKQAPGWTLEQPEPGVFRWTSPSGRIRSTYPTRYLI
jgi:hypothetical protein